MQLLRELDLAKNSIIEIDPSQQLRWQSSQIEFYSFDDDVTYYVNSTIMSVSSAYWIKQLKYLVVVDEGHQVSIVNTRANTLFTSDRFESEIDDIAFVPESDLLVIKTKSHVEIVDIKKRFSLSRFDAKIESFDNMLLSADFKHVGFETPRVYKVYQLHTGNIAVEFKTSRLKLKQARQLSNGSWVTQSGDNIFQWWDESGNSIKLLKAAIDINSGVILLENNHILCTDNDQKVFEIDQKGKLIASTGTKETSTWHPGYTELSTFSKITSLFIKGIETVERAAATKSSLYNFPHIFSAIGLSVDSVQVEGERILTGRSEKREEVGNKRLWNFFYRPKESELRNQFNQLMRDTSKADHECNELKKEWSDYKDNAIKEASKRGKVAIVTLLIGLFLIALSYYHDALRVENYLELFMLLGVPLFLWLSFSNLRKRKRAKAEIKDASQALSLLDTSRTLVSQVKEKIKAYRLMLVKQVPRVGQERPSDTEVRDHIINLLDGKIRSIALDECGLDEDDVNSTDADGNTIRTYINEPAYLQFSEGESIPRGINKHNLFSFFLGPNNEPLFGIQFIQYFFLSAKKIDAFTCYYDFINDEMVANEAHTFYYRDVTNISKRQIDLTTDNGSSSNLSKAKVGVEMKLVVASGDNIRINIATDETYRMMNEQVSLHTSHEQDAKIRNIDDEIRSLQSNTELSEEEKAEERADLLATREAIKAEFERRIDESYSSNADASQRIIQFVRGRLRELKED